MLKELSVYLPLSRLNTVVCLDEVESTNLYLRSVADEALDGFVLIARSQTLGRGCRGRSFHSPEGGLYLSMLFRPEGNCGSFMPCAAVAVRRALMKVCGLEAEIKWVNDLFLGGKKICGILAEKVGPSLIIGVGVNVNTPAFPPSLPEAGSLYTVTGREYELPPLAACIIEELDALAAGYPGNAADYREEYASSCLTLSREVEVFQGKETYSAFAEALDENFSLLVRLPDGKRETVNYGDVRLRAKNH